VEAFFEELGGGRWLASPSTVGPWDASSQHGGPPSALLARAIEACEPQPTQRLARLSVDILRPVPLGEIVVRTRVIRAGRRVTLVDALASAGGEPVVRAAGWRLERASDPNPPAIGHDYGLPPVGDALAPSDLGGFGTDGYLSAIEWLSGRGSLAELGPADVWARPRIELVAGETMSPFCRAVLVADSGSGVSSTLDARSWLFINVDLTVVLSRDPIGEWVLLGSRTTIEPSGTGIAETVLADQSGVAGRALQTLYVSRRDRADRAEATGLSAGGAEQAG
jgi:hypothetical protein